MCYKLPSLQTCIIAVMQLQERIAATLRALRKRSSTAGSRFLSLCVWMVQLQRVSQTTVFILDLLSLICMLKKYWYNHSKRSTDSYKVKQKACRTSAQQMVFWETFVGVTNKFPALCWTSNVASYSDGPGTVPVLTQTAPVHIFRPS
jgi:membrane protein insertase Oxa1/YidC/SpoIIIJ